MGRRRKTGLDDLLAIATALPWWLNIALGIGSFVALRALAGGEIPTATGTKDLSRVMVAGVLIGAGQIGQWIVPPVFALGAVFGLVRKRKAAGLVASVARDAQTPLTWREFESLVREIYRRQGYRVAATPDGADGGVDLVFANDDGKLLVQCKHWQARLVDVKIVRELKGVIAATGAVGGAVVTSGAFTRAALDFADKARIDLVDGQRLQVLARQLSTDLAEPPVSTSAAATGSKVEPERVRCPQCGGEMVLRTARRGAAAGQNFWGCSSYPKCRGTRQA